MVLLTIFASLFFVFSLVSARLERTVLTAPIVFTATGMLMFFVHAPIVRAGFNASIFLGLAELGLVLLLFTDASQTELVGLRNVESLSVRLLSVGMLLTIALGTLAALLVFPKLSVWEAGILGAILAPTDAGLGQVIVDSPRVPIRIREALKVEAGLNDGLSVPFLLFFMAIAAAKIEGGPLALTQFIGEQLGLGALVGVVIGLGGGWMMNLARRKEWMSESFQPIGVVTLPLLCLALSEMLGASMFIASFVAGLALQAGLKDETRQSIKFSGQWGELANLVVFFLFGLVVFRNFPQFQPTFWLYALLSLTVVRILPVAIASVGTGLSLASVLFMGWFGPRGLASIVLGLVYLEQELKLPGEPIIRLAVMVTVLLSIFAHGLSANSGIGLYTHAGRGSSEPVPTVSVTTSREV